MAMHANYDLTTTSSGMSSRISEQWMACHYTFHFSGMYGFCVFLTIVPVKRKSGLGQRAAAILELDCLHSRIRLLKEPPKYLQTFKYSLSLTKFLHLHLHNS